MINRLEEAIYSRGMTIGQINYMTGVSKATISRLVNDKNAGTSMEKGLKICKALKADPRDIFIIWLQIWNNKTDIAFLRKLCYYNCKRNANICSCKN